MKRYAKLLLIPLALILAPVAILIAFILLILVIFLIVGWCADAEQYRIQKEITAYVLENKSTIEIDSPLGHQAFHYFGTGSWDTEVNYGYYYSPEDVYLFAYEDPLYDESGIYGYPLSLEHSTPYKNGYREEGLYGDDQDWYYTEKICANWYYYELHDV